MANDIIGKLKARFDTLLNKTNAAIETGKTQIEIQQMKQKVLSLEKAIGKEVVARHLAGDVIVNLDEEQFTSKLKEIDFYTTKIKELEELVNA